MCRPSNRAFASVGGSPSGRYAALMANWTQTRKEARFIWLRVRDQGQSSVECPPFDRMASCMNRVLTCGRMDRISRFRSETREEREKRGGQERDVCNVRRNRGSSGCSWAVHPTANSSEVRRTRRRDRLFKRVRFVHRIAFSFHF